jgi:hypothetical protein
MDVILPQTLLNLPSFQQFGDVVSSYVRPFTLTATLVYDIKQLDMMTP